MLWQQKLNKYYHFNRITSDRVTAHAGKKAAQEPLCHENHSLLL